MYVRACDVVHFILKLFQCKHYIIFIERIKISHIWDLCFKLNMFTLQFLYRQATKHLFEHLIHLDYFTLVYIFLFVFGGEESLLGGKVISWWGVRLVARLPVGEVTSKCGNKIHINWPPPLQSSIHTKKSGMLVILHMVICKKVNCSGLTEGV